ncbi:putative MYND domain protein [Coniochaeta sp. 2T2.1]|nr:putative MYND domain protein [Coniochaeta sp. 2T2.1]
MFACQTCKTSPPEVTLKKCAKCSTTPYCSRDCQKADWKSHKKTCGKGAGAGAAAPYDNNSGSGTTGNNDSASAFSRMLRDSLPGSAAGGHTTNMGGGTPNPPKGLDGPINKPFTRLDNGTWLHDRPEKDVYRLLIDAYRLRMEDEYNIEGEADEDSIYGGASNGSAGFKRSLMKIEQRNRNLLPSWWDESKRAACMALGRQRGMFAEPVYWSAPGGGDGKGMRQLFMAMEGGGGGGMFEGMNVSAMGVDTSSRRR